MSDPIDRQAAIKAADSIIERDTSGNNDVVKAMTAWKEYIAALPSAQPRWITDVNNILAYLDGMVHPLISPENWNVYSDLYDMVSGLLKPWKGGQDEQN